MRRLLIFLCWFGVGFSAAGQNPACVIRTEFGDIVIEVYADRAPATAENFLHYVDHALYDSVHFFRACTQANEAGRPIKIEVIQGGDVPESNQLAPIRLETTAETGVSHTDGTLSMARDTPNSATTQFFICIGDQPELNYGGKRNPDGQGFGAFGKVTEGMDVVRRIQQQKEENQYLIKPVLIYSIRRL